LAAGGDGIVLIRYNKDELGNVGSGGTSVIDENIGGTTFRIHAFENVGTDTFTI
jgi:hypothetical protein